MENQLLKTIEELKKRIEILEQRRIYQRDIANDEVKMRHVGEGIRFIQTGLAASRPTTPQEPSDSARIYFAYDSNVLSVWNTSTNAWKTTTLS